MKKRQKNFFGSNVRFLPGSATHVCSCMYDKAAFDRL